MDGPDDPGLGAATTKGPLHAGTNGRMIRVRAFLQQGHSRQDHAVKAITALGRLFLHKSFLDRVQALVGRYKPFQGSNVDI